MCSYREKDMVGAKHAMYTKPIDNVYNVPSGQRTKELQVLLKTFVNCTKVQKKNLQPSTDKKLKKWQISQIIILVVIFEVGL